MKRSLLDRLSDWDASIRKGEGRRVRRELQALLRDARAEGRQAFERRELARLAALCRRTGLPEAGVRLLAPVVRPKARAVVRATPLEISEYAASLLNLGADREARELLDALSGEELPQALFFGALARFARWDYEGAIPCLKRYLAQEALGPYERRIGEVNLVAAKVAVFELHHHEPRAPSKADELSDHIDRLLTETRAEEELLLHGNLLEVQAQLLIERHEFRRARASLEQSARLLKEIGSTGLLYVRKWSAVLAALESPRSSSALDRLKHVRTEALASAQWETVRDCDFHLARALQLARSRSSSPTLRRRLDYLYFGTPHEPYRDRIARLFSYEPGPHYDWRIEAFQNDRAKYKAKTEAVQTMIDPLHHSRLKPGQVMQRLLRVLASDFYRPHRLASLHAELFPDRHFSFETSPQVVHQAMKRLREWFAREDLALSIEESQGSYRLTGSATIRTSRGPTTHDRAETQLLSWLQALTPHFAKNPTLSFQEIAAHSTHSSRTTHRLIAQAVASGNLLREGTGKRTLYRLNPSPRIT
jgi:hypothetical protein